MDANIEQETIKTLMNIVESDNYRVFVNQYKPKQEYSVNVYPYVPSANQH